MSTASVIIYISVGYFFGLMMGVYAKPKANARKLIEATIYLLSKGWSWDQSTYRWYRAIDNAHSSMRTDELCDLVKEHHVIVETEEKLQGVKRGQTKSANSSLH